jgi:hypothetical protein
VVVQAVTHWLDDDDDVAGQNADALDRLGLELRVHAALDELGVVSLDVRASMVDEPELALRLCEHAAAQRGLRDRAAYVVARWRRRHDPGAIPTPQLAQPDDPEREPGPPSLSSLEYLWSLDDGEVSTAALERLLALAIARHGGCHALLERSFGWREHFDVDGVLDVRVRST